MTKISLERYSTRSLLIALAGLMMLIDTAWGVAAVLPFDWSVPTDTVLGISFLLGLPAYLLDFWRKGRVVIFLPAVILLRGFAEYNAGSPATVGWQPTLGWQLWGNQLLIATFLILQWSKLQRRSSAKNLATDDY